MKKIIFTLLLASAMIQLNAQEIGIKGGYQVSNLTIDGISGITPDAKYMNNFVVGAFYHHPFNDNWGFQGELNLSQKGFVIKEGFDVDIFDFDVPVGAEARTRIKYIESPLLIKYRKNLNPFTWYVEAGPVIGYAVDADVKTRINAIIDVNIADTDINIDNDIYNRWEVGAAIGTGISVPLNSISQLHLGARYQHSISDLLDDPIIDVRGRNYGFSFQTGVSFRI